MAKLTYFSQQEECTFEPINKDDSKLKDLRWTTLGYHHNWDSKKYDEKKAGSVPDILNELAEVIQKLTKNDSFKAEASICNYYPAGIGTIGIHTDNSGKIASLDR